MRISSLLKKLLNVNEIVVENVRFEKVSGEEVLVIGARVPKRKQKRCGKCGRKSDGYDKSSVLRRWRALDLGTMKVFIEAASPRVVCKKHGVIASMVPWARHKSRFTYDFESMVTWMTLHSSKKVVSELMRVAWDTVGAITGRVYDDTKEASPDVFNNLTCIGIDETSYKKGHKYMTVVVDHTSGKLIWAAKGHGKKVLDEFFKLLNKKQLKKIRHVTADGAKWIKNCVDEYCKNAEISIDPFHVVAWATDALDEVRRDVWRTARKEAVKEKPRKRGRPRKGEEPTAKKAASAIKGSRYALLKNPDSLTSDQEVTMEMIVKENSALYRAYLLKEKLRLLLKLPLEKAMDEIDGWIKWARHCRIPQFVELQRKVGRHIDGILSSIEHNLSNARIEAINNKIKLTVRMGYGFRNIDNLIALVMMRCGNMEVNLPRRK